MEVCFQKGGASRAFLVTIDGVIDVERAIGPGPSRLTLPFLG